MSLSSARPPAGSAAAPSSRRVDGLPAMLGAIPIGVLFLALVLTPLGLTFVLTFRPFDYNTGIQAGLTLHHYATVLSDSYFLGIFWRTLWISVLTTAITRAPYPLATWMLAVPTPPAAPCTSTVSPDSSPPRSASANCAVR